MFLRTIAIAFLLGFAAPAMAQQVPPYVYPVTVTTGSAQVLPANSARKKLIFHNPNDSIKVAVCPSGPSRKDGTAITAAINGAGCLTLLPYQSIEITGGTPSGPQQAMGSAWLGIGSSSGALTIFEFE